ncbi:MFS transporter [Streptomyces sp. NRRL F-5126]|uniref:MFS transporter n=1 Tax=Streptomyces sp. NRRL F-5126 TaxID=1463857 RepID=UPI00068B8BF9|nr:MFS transporter [Streptomyces sp. NRRL F-5126]
MASSDVSTGRGRLVRSLGLPDVSGAGSFLTAGLIDSLGNGLVLAFQLVYFVSTTSLSAVEVGSAITLSRLLALPAPALIGPLMDRYGPRMVVVTGNALSALAFGGFLFAHDFALVLITGVAVQAGAAMFWTANSALTALAAQGKDRTRWFGLIRVIRNVGLGLGGAVSAAVVGTAGTTGLRLLVAANAVSYVVAAVLIARWRPRGAIPASRPGGAAAAVGVGDSPGAPRAQYALVLRDGTYLRLVAVNLVFVLAAMVLSILLALYTVEVLRAPAWLVGVLLTLNTALVIGGQSVATRFIERRSLARVAAVASALDALAFLLLSLLGGGPRWITFIGLFLGVIVFTFGEILASPTMSELSVVLAADHAQGRYLSIFQMSWTAGMALAPWLFTTLLSVGPRVPWLVLCALSTLAVPGMYGLAREIAARSDSAVGTNGRSEPVTAP